MSRERVRQDQQFWHLVKDLRWKLDDADAGRLPPGEPEFGYGGGDGSSVPSWATHAVAFLAGGVVFGLSLVAPAILPLVAAGALLGAILRFRRR